MVLANHAGSTSTSVGHWPHLALSKKAKMWLVRRNGVARLNCTRLTPSGATSLGFPLPKYTTKHRHLGREISKGHGVGHGGRKLLVCRVECSMLGNKFVACVTGRKVAMLALGGRKATILSLFWVSLESVLLSGRACCQPLLCSSCVRVVWMCQERCVGRPT